MSQIERRIALVCMTPDTDTGEANKDMPSYGIRRILASVAADPALEKCKLALIDAKRPDVDAYVEAIDAFEPDLVGMSIYVWSTPCLVEVAREVKRRRPDCTIVMGGPSARTALFDLPSYPDPHAFVDALVPSDGELTFREIARLPVLSRAALETVGGLDLPAPGTGWKHTGPRTPIDDLDEIASPFQMGLMTGSPVAYLETFRGCPFSCAFCEWGMSDSPKTVFSADYLARELETYQRMSIPAVFLVDAGLNLNPRGFKNLCEAERRVGFLRNVPLWSEIYPSHVKEEHLEFLRSVHAGYLGIGLQSMDPAVLKPLQRHFDLSRFDHVVRQLADVANAEIQIIFGLPGDTPEGFRRTLAYARTLPATVRAYHCLVLPDALLTRSRPEWDVRFDPVTLEMISCRGWSEDELLEMREWAGQEARAAGGASGDYWYFFPRSA
jgi:radical SAM superfamily enzyme YgiQ (UPF0313 family)